jgi:hypothetical protein
MDFETPSALLGRLKLGREELCQRLLTTLILHGPYPRWNTRSVPGPAGLQFLRELHDLSYDGTWPGGDLLFVDEFELPPPTDGEKGGAPDYAVIWPDRLWLIELKTEKGSHRPTQIPSYFRLARHHHPTLQIDLLYVTPPMVAPFRSDVGRYAHLTWTDLAEPIKRSWPSGTDPGQQEVIDGLLGAIDSLHLAASSWRAALALPPVPTQPPIDPVPAALEAARATAEDGAQRAVDHLPQSLEELLALRLSVRDELAASPADSPLRHVVPWIWRPESTGRPLTSAGATVGMELRVSRYAAPQH